MVSSFIYRFEEKSQQAIGMVQDTKVIKKQHERFIKEVCESEVVWILGNKTGYSTSGSNEYEDADGNLLSVICVWSDKSMAISCAKEDWTEYQPTEISLSEFIENWCVGMFENSMLVGTNFDENMCGLESNPLDLIVELVSELKRTRKNIPLQLYKGLDDLLCQVEQANK